MRKKGVLIAVVGGAVGMVFILFGCGGSHDKGGYVGDEDSEVPRVRLVKDGDDLLHFQWDEPLKEERFILVRATVRDRSGSMT